MEINDLSTINNNKKRFSEKEHDRNSTASDWQRQRKNHLKRSTNSKSRQKVWSESLYFVIFL